jgi:hypothetical protein
MTKPTLFALLLVLAGLVLGLAVMAAGWVVVNRGFGTRRFMVDDLDIDRSAKLLIDQHGEDASGFAAKQADKQAEVGDLDGQAVWLRVLSAIEELQRTGPGDGAAVH